MRRASLRGKTQGPSTHSVLKVQSVKRHQHHVTNQQCCPPPWAQDHEELCSGTWVGSEARPRLSSVRRKALPWHRVAPGDIRAIT